MKKNKLLILTLLGLIGVYNTNIFGATKLYEKKDIEVVTNGVVYENSLRATDAGIQDVHVLTVDISNEYISLNPVFNEEDYGRRDNVLNMLNKKNAVAGVNGDFFGVSNIYSAAFGPEFVDGELVSLSTGFNKEENNFASFYIEKDNNPFILYLRPEIDFKTNGKESIEVFAINKITDMVFPVLVNRLAMDDTSGVDARFPNTLKIVVANNTVIYKSEKGETVDVPENGYVVIIGEKSADYFQQFYEVGQTAELTLRGGIDYNNIQTAIGGAGRVLLEGVTVSDTGTVIAGRQPRTAIGISQDNSKIILLSVDGRGDSIGASHNELADLLKEYGAYNAMHLDGGGSTTMVTSTYGNTNLKVVTTPSDGGLRSVINALGVFNNAPDNLPMAELKVDVSDGFNNAPITVNAYGLNEAYGRIELDKNNLTYQSDDLDSYWDNNVFYPSRVGKTTITVMDNQGFVASSVIDVKKLVELRADKSSFYLKKDESASFIFTGISDTGEELPITSGVKYEVIPNDIGYMNYGTFISNGGSGYVKASLGDVETYISVYSTSKTVMLDNFDEGKAVSFTSYNGQEDEILGFARYVDGVVELGYDFPLVEGTQAAYIKFDDPITLVNDPSKISLDVYGDNSGNWLRGQVIDSKGEVVTIDFAKEINWEGYNKVLATIPSTVNYPVYLSRLYVVTTDALVNKKDGIIRFDNLTMEVPYNDSNLSVPTGHKYIDPMKQDIVTPPIDGSYDITVIGHWLIEDEESRMENYNDIRNEEMYKIRSNATQVFYAGDTDYTTDIGVPVYKWVSGYDYFENNNFGVIQLLGDNTGLIGRDNTQWNRFVANVFNSNKKDILIMIDKNPLEFTNKDELTLFQNVLVEAKNNGKRIFVVSSEGALTTENIINGVRYINLGSLFNNKNEKNNGFGTLRFRITGDNIVYQIRN